MPAYVFLFQVDVIFWSLWWMVIFIPTFINDHVDADNFYYQLLCIATCKNFRLG